MCRRKAALTPHQTIFPQMQEKSVRPQRQSGAGSLVDLDQQIVPNTKY